MYLLLGSIMIIGGFIKNMHDAVILGFIFLLFGRTYQLEEQWEKNLKIKY